MARLKKPHRILGSMGQGHTSPAATLTNAETVSKKANATSSFSKIALGNATKDAILFFSLDVRESSGEKRSFQPDVTATSRRYNSAAQGWAAFFEKTSGGPRDSLPVAA